MLAAGDGPTAHRADDTAVAERRLAADDAVADVVLQRRVFLLLHLLACPVRELPADYVDFGGGALGGRERVGRGKRRPEEREEWQFDQVPD